MSYKKFSKILFFIATAFVLLNLIIWEIATKEILVREDIEIKRGDMTRMGYLPSLNHERKNFVNLSKKHLNHFDFNTNEPIDIVTIGDSFSNGIGGGLNRFYQDYLATYTNKNILNITQLRGTRNYLETVLLLLNNGELEKRGVQYVIVESTQRKIVTRFSIPIDVNIDFQDNQLIEKNFKKINHDGLQLPQVTFINNGNFKYLLYTFLYNFSPNAFISKVYKEKLNQKFFSIGDGNDLLFYKSDLDSIKKNTQKNLEKVNKNLNILANRLKEKNIQLIFLPAITKYDLYKEYMKKTNKYPNDPFFDILRGLEKEYIFIDTKKILKKELKKGTQDIFYVDDTHWSYKASSVIMKELANLIEDNQ